MYMASDSLKIEIVDDAEVNKKVELVCRQTNYSKEEALEKLENHKFDEMMVIKDYIKGDKVQENNKENKTVHEMIHGEIRSYFKN